MGIHIDVPIHLRTGHALEDAVRYIIDEPFYFVNDFQIDQCLKVILDNISTCKPSDYDLELLMKIEWIKKNVKNVNLIINDYNETNKRKELEFENRTVMMNQIINIFKQRNQNMATKEYFIGMLKSLKPTEIESLVANTQLSDDGDYRCLVEAEREWTTLGKPKAPILGLGLWIGLNEPNRYQFNTGINFVKPAEHRIEEWIHLNQNNIDFNSCKLACHDIMTNIIEDDEYSYVIIDGNTMCTIAMIEVCKSAKLSCYIPAPHLNHSLHSYLNSDMFTKVG